MNEVLNYFEKELKLKKSDIIVAAVSGGPDSMFLLNALLKLQKKVPYKIICCHVNHNVRKESADEKIFLENYCQKNKIFFESMVIAKYGDDNFHNEARNIRYHFFNEIVLKYQANYLMTAHHGDDLMETILMRIVRGSTLSGYAGFKQIVIYPSYKLVRPLIHLTKEEIVTYCDKNHIPYVVDQSNNKDKYTRNRYRKNILPFLKSEDPKVHEKFWKFSNTLMLYNDYLNKELLHIVNSVYQNNILDINNYLKLDICLQNRLLDYILESIYHDDLILINDHHNKLLKNLIISKKANTIVYLPNNIKVIKSYAKIEFVNFENTISNYEIELNDYVTLPNGKKIEKIAISQTNGNDVCYLNSKEICLPLIARTRQYGDKMTLLNTKGHSKLKDIFIDKKLDTKSRSLWPVVTDSKGEIVWLPGLKKSKYCKTKTEEYDIILKYY